MAGRRAALLADLPRVGKTGTAIVAADLVLAQRVLVVTTASGRGVWRRGWSDWQALRRTLQVLEGKDTLRPETDVCVVSWGALTQARMRSQLLARRWDLLIPDEAHAAKNFEAKRTQALYGMLEDRGATLNAMAALIGVAERVWPLTGTPLPNCPLDIYPMLRALAPDRLKSNPARGWPDVTEIGAFTDRYAKMRPKRIGHGFYARTIQVFVEGRNESELRDRLEGFYLQRTQQDVGILEPDYETMPLAVPNVTLPSVDTARVLQAAREGNTRDLDMHLGPLRRLTGEIKARAVIDAVKEELDAGLDKVVLAYWHTDVGHALAAGLAQFGVVGLDGSATSRMRADAEHQFRTNPAVRVFLGQIQAAGEAIDLSAARHLIFVENSILPKDMKQMSLRITNHTQQQKPLVRVATLEGSIDDALQQILMRKWTAIKGVLER